MGDPTSPGAATPRGIKLDPLTREFVWSNGRLVWTSGAEAIAQAIDLAFGFFKGEWFLDQNIGADWYSILGRKPYEPGRARAFARAVLLGVAGVLEITALDPVFDSIARHLTITWTVTTDYGPLTGTSEVALP